LPELVPVKRYCSLGIDAEGFYQRTKEQMKKSLGDHKAMESAFMRARQISSGFIGYEDDAGERASYVFDEQPKLDLLQRYLEEDWDDRFKFIIFHEFNFSGEQLAKRMEKLGIGYVLGNGKTKDADVPRIKRKFKEDKRCQCFLLSNSWGGYGLNMQIAKYGLYYEAPVSPIIRRQTQRRYERQHSPHSEVYSVDFIMKGTSDETILGYHAEGKRLWKAVLGVGKHEKEGDGLWAKLAG
jgi:SNF2 family DNA or RNA helicase